LAEAGQGISAGQGPKYREMICSSSGTVHMWTRLP
jgi:hypothetical protein